MQKIIKTELINDEQVIEIIKHSNEYTIINVHPMSDDGCKLDHESTLEFKNKHDLEFFIGCLEEISLDKSQS